MTADQFEPIVAMPPAQHGVTGPRPGRTAAFAAAAPTHLQRRPHQAADE